MDAREQRIEHPEGVIEADVSLVSERVRLSPRG